MNEVFLEGEWIKVKDMDLLTLKQVMFYLAQEGKEGVEYEEHYIPKVKKERDRITEALRQYILAEPEHCYYVKASDKKTIKELKKHKKKFVVE